ncbi:protein FAM124A isoform X2 [Anarhichas minor]|uniref:protein FAM124A isoform X2 n=1 Tax=Anarhichas minor TaxID=65739 RepID=UPI003F736CAD
MEKSSEDECVDSGAETAGSDYSPLSSTSSEFSMGELQDPFLVCVHLIADPGQGKLLQRAADGVLAWVHPELQLFRVSERASVCRPKRHQNGGPVGACQPALAVIVFLQEAHGGEEQVLMLHRALQRPPWCFHHTEKVSNGRRMSPLSPCSQDFFTLSPGTPLWAMRQVHYGKEIVRFTVYCRHENYVDMVRLYKLLLQRRPAQKKEDFCFFVVYSNPEMEIQLSFKRLPRGQSPAVLESAVMEVRVRDIGTLVPLLPQPCSPISEVRWQTEDYDGNKILLQVRGSPSGLDPVFSESASAPSTFLRSAASYRNHRHRHHHRSTSQDQWDQQDQQDQWATWRPQWRGQRSGSTCSSPGPSPSPHHRGHSLHRSSSLVPPFRLNLDALVGAEETDVDTGDQVSPVSGTDLSVVSAYIRPSLPQTSSRPLSAPPGDIGPSLSPLGRVPIGSVGTWFAAPSLSDGSVNQSDSCSIVSAPADEEDEEDEEEEEEEFYI